MSWRSKLLLIRPNFWYARWRCLCCDAGCTRSQKRYRRHGTVSDYRHNSLLRAIYTCLDLHMLASVLWFGYQNSCWQHSFWYFQNWILQAHFCRIFESIALHSFLPTHLGDIIEGWVCDYNDVNGAELACKGITIIIPVGIFLEGVRKRFGWVQ